MAPNIAALRWAFGILFGLALFCLCQGSPAGHAHHHSSHDEPYLLQNATISSRDYLHSENLLHYLSKRAPPTSVADGAEKADNELLCLLRAPTAKSSEATEEQLEKNWTEEKYVGGIDKLTTTGESMPAALKALKLPASVGKRGLIGFIWKQDKPFVYKGEDEIASNGFYMGSMSVEAGYISAENNRSPVQKANDPRPEPYKLSDVYFLQWAMLAGNSNKIKSLRYFIRANVENQDTLDIINEATGNVLTEWPGRLFSMEENEGKAILRTPNGVGLAYMLIQHKKELGHKIPTGVRVFKTTDSGITHTHLVFYIANYKGA